MQNSVQRARLARTRAVLVALAALAALAPAGCSEAPVPSEPLVAEASAPVPVPEATGPRDVAVVQIKKMGTIRIELLPELAPSTVDNFIELAEQRFYDGTTFHRVIPDFMIQGGDPNSKNRDARDDGKGGPGYSIEDEFSDTAHLRGIVSMANNGYPRSAGSQFFIVVDDARDLDGKYAVFGRVIDGMDVVDRISRVERDQYGRHGPRDRPMRNVVIEHIRIDRGAGGSSIAESSDEAPAGRIDLAPGGATSAAPAPPSGAAALPAAPDPGAL